MAGDPKPPPTTTRRGSRSPSTRSHAQVGERLDYAGHGAIQRIRLAFASKDTASLKSHLAELRESHGWLYKELAEHPRIAQLLDELALFGL